MREDFHPLVYSPHGCTARPLLSLSWEPGDCSGSWHGYGVTKTLDILHNFLMSIKTESWIGSRSARTLIEATYEMLAPQCGRLARSTTVLVCILLRRIFHTGSQDLGFRRSFFCPISLSALPHFLSQICCSSQQN